MSGRKESVKDLTKNSRRNLSMDIKLKVIRKIENGKRQVDVCRELNLPGSTVRTIMQNAEKIKRSVQSTTPLSATKTSRTRNTMIEKMEKLLTYWIEDQNNRDMPLSQAVIMEKARGLFEELEKQNSDESSTSSSVETFAASRGWFEKFKVRANIHNIKICGEAASADVGAVKDFTKSLKSLIAEKKYPPELIFNVDETGLFWKRMPSKTFISKEEKRSPGFKAAKDRLTLLLGGNASGDFKLKPLLLYHSENPRAMKGYSKDNLTVIWMSNRKAWVTAAIFELWFVKYFCPAVKDYCESKKLESRALLIIDNAPGHVKNIAALSKTIPVEVIFLPPNTTSLIQPMDQGVIANFKAYYIRRTFKQLLHAVDVQKETILKFWKSFNIMMAIETIRDSWNDVTNDSMRDVWNKILLKENENSVPDNLHSIIVETVQIAHDVGFDDLMKEDVEEIINLHDAGLSNEDLIEIGDESYQNHESEDDENVEPPKRLTKKVLQENLEIIAKALNVLTDNDPDSERAGFIKRGVSKSLTPYTEILKEKQLNRQQSKLDQFFVRNM